MNKINSFFAKLGSNNENDDIHNVFAEHKDWQVILEYDLTWYVTTDSDENKSNSGDDNDEYTKPTCNDLNLGVGYALLDDHNEVQPIY